MKHLNEWSFNNLVKPYYPPKDTDVSNDYSGVIVDKKISDKIGIIYVKIENYGVEEFEVSLDKYNKYKIGQTIDVSIEESLDTNKSKIYLAGGWGKFRSIVMNDTDAEWLNPETMTDRTNWFDLEVEAVRNSDGMIAWFEKGNPSGFGMTYEMGIAYGLDIPYLLICEDLDMLKYKFGMQSLGAEKTFTSWDDALEYINETNWLNIKK